MTIAGSEPNIYLSGDVYLIGDLAREFGVTLRALRFYEAKGLLAPRREGTVRLYSEEDRGRLALIRQAKRLGFTLFEIAKLIVDGRQFPITRAQCLDQIRMMERRKLEAEDALAELRRIYSGLYVQAAE